MSNVLTLSLNHACNLRCAYCYAGDKFSSAMPLSVARKALDLAFKRPGQLIDLLFFGGEPLLEMALLDTIATEATARAAAEGRRARLSLTTNATLIDEARLTLLKEHKIHVTVSLDGCAAAHDPWRRYPDGRGSHAATVEGIQALMAAGIDLKVIGVVHPGNMGLLVESLEFVVGLGLKHFKLNIDHDADWSEAQLDALEAHMRALTARLADYFRVGVAFRLDPIDGRIISHLQGGRCIGCAFGEGEIAVAPSGHIYPCERLIGEDGPAQDDVLIGHVDIGVLPERLAAVNHQKNTPHPECEGCDYISRCVWWCGCVNRAHTGKPGQINDALCRMEQISISAADEMAAALYQEKNPLFMKRFYKS
ncbi:radical SAM protein [Myxococcota bacterium]|nr:radical SAM protein [Myxococcota bacterium]